MPQMNTMSPVGQDTRGSSNLKLCSLRLVLALATFILCVVTFACDNTKIIWSTEAPSSDRKWVATAESVEHKGPGNNDVETKVYLKPSNSNKRVEVLGFFHDPTLISRTINLQLVWKSPTQLQVTYTNHPKLYLQVAQVEGVKISTEEQPTGTQSRR
jgi:hypothetical protein